MESSVGNRAESAGEIRAEKCRADSAASWAEEVTSSARTPGAACIRFSCNRDIQSDPFPQALFQNQKLPVPLRPCCFVLVFAPRCPACCHDDVNDTTGLSPALLIEQPALLIKQWHPAWRTEHCPEIVARCAVAQCAVARRALCRGYQNLSRHSPPFRRRAGRSLPFGEGLGEERRLRTIRPLSQPLSREKGL